jgi:hypothetical protein
MTNPEVNAVIEPEDLTFLVEFRDYLNSAASPATGSTIAFSTFVSDRAAGYRSEDARKAYPGYERLALKLRIFVSALGFFSVVATIVVAGLAAYVYWGNAIVSAAAGVYAQEADLQKDIQREQATNETSVAMLSYARAVSHAAEPPDVQLVSRGQTSPDITSAGIIPLCDAFNYVRYNDRLEPAYLTSTQENLCEQEIVLETQLNSFETEIIGWQSILHLSHLVKEDGESNPQLLRIAPHLLSMINGYAIPLLMGFLGSSAFVLRGFLKRLGDRILTTRDIHANTVRIVLGVLSGLAIGFFLGPTGGGSSPTNALGMGINLTAPALAFLAGYAVEVLFKFLDTIAGQAFSVK